jgi:hypothetical protein
MCHPSLKSLKRLRKELGLQSVRQQNHTVDSALEKIQEIREIYPTVGVREMVRNICHETEGKVKVSK